MSARRFYRRHGNSIKVTGVQATGGAAVAFLDKQLLSSPTAVAAIGQNTYVKPILVMAIGHFVKSKAPNLGAGICGAAGYMLAETYFSTPTTANKVPAPPAPAQVPAAGLVDAGNVFGPGQMYDAYAGAGAVYEVQPG